MFNILSAVGSTVNATGGMMVNVQEKSTVHHLVDQKQIHCNRAVQFTPSKRKRSSCQQHNCMLVLAFTGKWKYGKVLCHLEDCGHQKKMVNA